MSAEQTIRTTREVAVLRIPSGEQIHLPAGTPVARHDMDAFRTHVQTLALQLDLLAYSQVAALE